MLKAFEKRMIFIPSVYPEGDWALGSPSLGVGEVGMHLEDVWLTTADGVKLHGWYATPVRGVLGGGTESVAPIATLLWCHGNAGNLSHRRYKLELLSQLPVAVLIFDYRGYGRSEGEPSEAGIYADARAAWDWLDAHAGPRDGTPRIIVGVSLGGAPATQLATQVAADGLALEATFTSVPDMAQRVLPWVPRFLVSTQMDTQKRVRTLETPVAIMHGDRDEVIPFAMGETLRDAVPGPVLWLAVPGAGHNDLSQVAGQAYLDHYRAFIAQCRPSAAPAATPDSAKSSESPSFPLPLR